jgi:hypothetical protein
MLKVTKKKQTESCGSIKYLGRSSVLQQFRLGEMVSLEMSGLAACWTYKCLSSKSGLSPKMLGLIICQIHMYLG